MYYQWMSSVSIPYVFTLYQVYQRIQMYQRINEYNYIKYICSLCIHFVWSVLTNTIVSSVFIPCVFTLYKCIKCIYSLCIHFISSVSINIIVSSISTNIIVSSVSTNITILTVTEYTCIKCMHSISHVVCSFQNTINTILYFSFIHAYREFKYEIE